MSMVYFIANQNQICGSRCVSKSEYVLLESPIMYTLDPKYVCNIIIVKCNLVMTNSFRGKLETYT